ncbi:MarC family protein [Chlamydiifrater phoenicopteri]|uniref:MarC family protein n=1 Tax=Chlamydiifrater phoenicopteri TaxID=2681469 RepID=UPI001BD05977|nr:MarC family protein [Chlamydiifrater phoenicopteri]
MTIQLLSFSLVLCLIADSFLNMAHLQAIFQSFSLKRSLLLLSRDLLISLPIIFILFFVGKGALSALRTPDCAILASAGALITLNGLKASFNKSKEIPEISKNRSLLFPVATPLIIGPAWFAGCFVLIISNPQPREYSYILGLSWIFLFFSTLTLFALTRKDKVLQASRAIIGLFVSIIGVQIFIRGLQLALLAH